MGIIELFVAIVLVVVIGFAAIWIIGQLAPTHPAIIDKIIWVVVVIVIGALLFTAFGGHDVAVPQLRR